MEFVFRKIRINSFRFVVAEVWRKYSVNTKSKVYCCKSISFLFLSFQESKALAEDSGSGQPDGSEINGRRYEDSRYKQDIDVFDAAGEVIGDDHRQRGEESEGQDVFQRDKKPEGDFPLKEEMPYKHPAEINHYVGDNHQAQAFQL